MMDNSTKPNTEQWSYSGDRLKSFLQRRNISYKEAAEDLGIDKNTVGKAVRGGNLNIDIILRICNTYGLCIYDFFKQGDDNKEDAETNYYFGSCKENYSILNSAEPELNYKKSKKSDLQIEELSQFIAQIKTLISEMDEKIEKSATMLQEMKENNR